LRALRLSDQALAFVEPLSLCFRERGRIGFTRGNVGSLQRRNLRRILLPPGGPGCDLFEVVAAQQEVVSGGARLASRLPAHGDFSQSRVFANPFDILPQRRRQFGDGLEGRLAFAKEDIVQTPQPLGHVGLSDRVALDRNQPDRDQPLAELRGAIHLPGAALGLDGGGRDDEDDGVGALDQRAKPSLPVFRSGDVVPVEKRREPRKLEPGHEVFGQRRAIRTGVGDEDLQPFCRAFDRVGAHRLPAAGFRPAIGDINELEQGSRG
jgi:hypothetical protein